MDQDKLRDEVKKVVDFGGMHCPRPVLDYPNVTLAHGGGGRLSQELVQHIFLPAFQNECLSQLGDSAVWQLSANRIAVSTDSYVVRPLFFPGGSIGDLAVNGTVNDICMSGARPVCLTAGFIITEGLAIDRLKRIADDMGAAARQAGVAIIAGDTKVVERGNEESCFINTAGFGIVPDGIDIGPDKAQPGDLVIVSGSLGDHGMAVMSVREGLEFETPITSDTAPLNAMVAAMLRTAGEIHVLRDPTRGGLAASLNEIAAASSCGIVIEELRLPINPIVQSACEILGLDPLLVANEGKVICIVPACHEADILQAMRDSPYGTGAVVIGKVVANHPGMVVARTALGTSRVIPLPIGEQLPRIC